MPAVIAYEAMHTCRRLMSMATPSFPADLTSDDFLEPVLERFDRAAFVLGTDDTEHCREETESEDHGEENGGEHEQAELHEEDDLGQQKEGRTSHGRTSTRQHRDTELYERVVETPAPFVVRRPTVSFRQMHDVVHR